ncbi:ribosomal RNA-processing protein 8 [Populus alba x Populus x berolinensis]|nr:ribosomal RNA-processing protein 8 [Populus alba x Populus x berolinensis]
MKETRSRKRKREKHGKPQNMASASSKITKSSSNFLDKMRARLSGGHFRMINEKLYTCTGDEALDYFKEDPSLFDMYHTGYQEQMSHWPEQPVNIITQWLKARSSSLVVADFGCGDARLAKNVKNKVFSFDLVSNDPSVIACDMSNTPLDASSIDVAVFCLSLMGTNFPSYLEEAHRVLKPRSALGACLKHLDYHLFVVFFSYKLTVQLTSALLVGGF